MDQLWFLFSEHLKYLSLFLSLGVTPFKNLLDCLIIFEKTVICGGNLPYYQ